MVYHWGLSFGKSYALVRSSFPSKPGCTRTTSRSSLTVNQVIYTVVVGMYLTPPARLFLDYWSHSAPSASTHPCIVSGYTVGVY